MSLLHKLLSFPLRGIRYFTGNMYKVSCSFGAKSHVWARIHYAFFNPTFGREQQAFLAGRCAYNTSLQAPSGTLALLRRNVHRLEKGLLMKPRRVPFALDYITETVSAYVGAVNSEDGSIDPEEMAWASDVLVAYFSAHEDEVRLAELAGKFRATLDKNAHASAVPRIPYLRDLDACPVSYEALAALAKRRRSVRWFAQKPVRRDLIDKALEVGAQAPSACNRQPFQYRFFDDYDIVQRVINVPFGLAGYGHQVPVIAVVIGQQRHFFDERDRHLIYIDASLSVMGFLFALESLGLASCCINWPDIEEKERKLAELLNLAPDERPVMLIALGYPDPDGMVANSTKKSLNQLRRYNFE
jgi:nitroreductase